MINQTAQVPTRLLGPFAHTPVGGRLHTLDEHHRTTALLAKQYAEPCGLGAAAYVTGLLHDLGKAAPEFQVYLAAAARGKAAPRFPHAKWGAAVLWDAVRADPLRRALAMSVLGHHRGLGQATEARQDLEHLLKTEPERIAQFQSAVTRTEDLPAQLRLLSESQSGATDTEVRFIFSALIDADRTDTARHFGQTLADDNAITPTLIQTWDQRMPAAPRAEAPLLAQVRHRIREDCRANAALPPGLFLLTAPTGTGKTLSSMEFALHHAQHHGLKRIIVVLPYTSITQQTARVYRDRLGGDVVLEHHSQARTTDESEGSGAGEDARLAAERWDKPIVVTTSVQFFESLFGNRPSQLRKLHRIARSVVILDEFQAFPVGLLEPTVRMLRELAAKFGTTIVFSSATQPALDALPPALRLDGREIVQDPEQHFSALRRVAYEYRPGPTSWTEVVDEVLDTRQALVILNTKREALEVMDLLSERDDTALFHLSTSMCGMHRSHVLAEVGRRLNSDEPVHLVSTQVVETGVDLDFPVVYRALGPLERVIQGSGRCNREGRLASGRVVIFRPERGSSPGGTYRTGMGVAARLMDEHGTRALEDLNILRGYFQEVRESEDLDREKVQKERALFNFESVSERYRLIEDDTRPVVVKYGPGDVAIQTARHWTEAPSLSGLRRLQPFLVSIKRQDWAKAHEADRIIPLRGELGIWTGRYDEKTGLREGNMDPEELVF